MPKPINRDNFLRNISRMDRRPYPKNAHGSTGWWVRFRINGRSISEYFSDTKFQGKEKAFDAAVAFRDAIVREMKPPSPQKPYETATRRSTSGIIGVNRSSSYSINRLGKKYPFVRWQAHWPILGGIGKKAHASFSVRRYGEEGALRLAIQARKRGLAKFASAKQPMETVFNPPNNPDIKVWRYMDFTKYVSMLVSKALFFPRVSDLNDPFEGSFSRGNARMRQLVYQYKKPINDIGRFLRELRDWVVVSCWHMSEHESAAMWSLYSKGQDALCIQTTYRLLAETLGPTVPIGIVQYVDYEREWIPEDNPLLPFLYKRESYRHESEIRPIINLSKLDAMGKYQLKGKPPCEGILRPVDLTRLIQSVYIAPNTPNWFHELIVQVSNSFGLVKIPIIKSSLDKEPFY